MIAYEEFVKNVEVLKSRLQNAADRSGRDVEHIRILPVTKTFPIDAVEYCLRYGFKAVGENRVQEVVQKQGDYRSKIGWELIGHLQSNKVKPTLQHFDVVQSVDSTKLLEKLQRACADVERELPILLQVNAGNDPAKYGIDLDLVDAAVEQTLKCDLLKLEGLMTIAPLSEDPAVARKTFSNLRRTLERINREFGLKLDQLSMGMTGDLEHAVEEGSTCIRVGTALFGERPPRIVA